MSGTADFGAIWTPAAAGNFDTSRSQVDLIILHHTACLIDAATARFQTPGTQVSAHFGVAQDGTIRQYVALTDTAYHSGYYAINQRSVGVEHESGPVGQDFFTDAQYLASGQLLRQIAAHFGFAVDIAHVWPHSRVTATACPGVLDRMRLISGGLPVSVQALRLRQPITGQVYDITSGVFTASNGTKSATTEPDNDRGFYDFNTLPNSYTKVDAAVGESVTVNRCTLASDGKWYWGRANADGSDAPWALNDNALDLSDAAAKFGFFPNATPDQVVVAVPAATTPPVVPAPPAAVPPTAPVVPPAATTTTATTTTATTTTAVVDLDATPVPGKGCLAALLGIR